MFDDMIKKINAQEIDFRTRNEERLKNEESLNDSINENIEYMFMDFIQNYFPNIMEKNMSKLLEMKNRDKYLSERVLLTKEDLIQLRFDEDFWNFTMNENVSDTKIRQYKYFSLNKFMKYVIERFSLYGIDCKSERETDDPVRNTSHDVYFFEGKISQFEEMFIQEMQRINYEGISNYDVPRGYTYR